MTTSPTSMDSTTRLLPAFSSRSLLYLLLASILTVAGIVAGGALTDNGMLWYRTILKKPWFTPPNLAFPIAWTTLYLLMAFSLWRILRVSPNIPGRGIAILAFLAQLALNVVWSWLFFDRQDPASALFEVFIFEAAIFWMIIRFHPLDRLASRLMWPYALWVAFASFLNLTIVAMNPVLPTLWNR